VAVGLPGEHEQQPGLAVVDEEVLHDRQHVAGLLEGLEGRVVEATGLGVEAQAEGGDLHAGDLADRRACPVFRLDSARDRAE
jgi:hypothetical protein